MNGGVRIKNVVCIYQKIIHVVRIAGKRLNSKYHKKLK